MVFIFEVQMAVTFQLNIGGFTQTSTMAQVERGPKRSILAQFDYDNGVFIRSTKNGASLWWTCLW